MPWLLVAKVVVLGLPFVALALAGQPVLAAVCHPLTAAHLAVAAANGWRTIPSGRASRRRPG
jgi:hypothetical protein